MRARRAGFGFLAHRPIQRLDLRVHLLQLLEQIPAPRRGMRQQRDRANIVMKSHEVNDPRLHFHGFGGTPLPDGVRPRALPHENAG